MEEQRSGRKNSEVGVMKQEEQRSRRNGEPRKGTTKHEEE